MLQDNPAKTDDESEISIGDLLAQVLARKWVVVATTILGVAGGLFMGQLPPDEYRASALVNIEQRGPASALPDALSGRGLVDGPSTRIDAEAHIIQSRFVLGPIVRELNLDWRLEPDRFPIIGHVAERRAWPTIPEYIVPRYARYGDDVRLDLLEVDSPLINRRAQLRITGENTFEAWLPDGPRVAGQVGEIVTLASGFRFRITRLNAPRGRSFSLWRMPINNAIGQLRSGLDIRERRPANSGIVDFHFRSQDRDLARRAANAVVLSYQEQTLNRRSAEIDRSLEFIETNLAEVRQNTARATEQLNEFRQQSQAVALTSTSQELLNRIVGIQAELEELAFREEQMARRLTPNHPEYRAMLDQRARLESRLEEMREEATALPPIEQELLQLTQTLERSIEFERQLIVRREQLSIVRASAISNVHMLEEADTARLTGPNRTQPILIGLFLGLSLGIGGILSINFLRRGIDDSRTIEELGLPLFATINRVPGLRSAGADTKLYRLARTAPGDIVVESLRGLRTGLQFSLATAPRKSLMITSPAPSLGKSFICMNLGIVAAQSGAQVLLIDADMRKGKLRRQFDIGRDHPGLSELLSRRCGIEDALYNDPNVEGLDFIAAGKYPPSPADLLNSAVFDKLMEEAAAAYDLVIVDSPPVLAVTDPAIIGQKTGMSLLVVKHLETTRAEVVSSMKLLNTSGVKLSGAVLNQFDAKASRYGQYGHKYGYYGGYKYGYE